MIRKQIKKLQQLEDAPNIENYWNNPVQNFGMNLLKGMGFTSQRGIGFNKQNALKQPLILKSRPKGLGLGAQIQGQPTQNYQFNKKDHILIKSQPHKGMIGIIKKVNNQDKILTIQLGVSGTQIKLKFQQAEPITEEEYHSRKANILIQQNNQGQQKKKRRIKWILPSIICKVINKTSVYYLKKIIVNQLISDRQFQCIHINENGERKYLRNLTQKDLQTVIPKAGMAVLLLDRKIRGKKAKLLERNKQKSQVIVQILETLQIQKIDQNLVSEFIEI